VTQNRLVARSSAGRRRLHTLLLVTGGILVSLYFVAPFSWLILTSVMRETEALSVPPHWLPHDPTLANYLAFFGHAKAQALLYGSRAAENTLPGVRNSFLVAAGTAILNLALGTLAGYSFARLRFPGRTLLLFVYVGSRMVPGIALIVPLYLVVKALGLLDSLFALIVTYLTFTLPFTIWLLKSYFQGIPRELEEAGLVDGCSWLRMVANVLLPAALPGLVAAAMFAFMTAWNDYLFAVILTTSMASKTAPVVVAGFATDVTTSRTLMVTGGVLTVVPPLLLALACQRLIVQGVTSGSTKG
jgi:multiple sugar transport system permease protein